MSNWESSSKPWYVRWGITFAAGLVIVFGFACVKDIFHLEGAARVWRVLCDGCFLAAVLLIGVGLMTLVSSEGTFDILAYGTLCLRSVFTRNGKDRFERLNGESGGRPSFYDYKVAKRGTRHTHWYLVFVGLIFLAAAFVCMLMFNWAGGIPMA